MFSRLLIVFFVSVVTACSTIIEREGNPGDPEKKYRPVGMVKKAETSGNGLKGLINKAAAQIDDGNMEAGLATLERALRIAPKDASIYLSMAMVYSNLGNSLLAANLAARGLLYCERGKLCRQLEALVGQ